MKQNKSRSIIDSQFSEVQYKVKWHKILKGTVNSECLSARLQCNNFFRVPKEAWMVDGWTLKVQSLG